MLTLYSYPPLFGVADNNGYGLKVYAFLELARVRVDGLERGAAKPPLGADLHADLSH